jgi:hypothetical protein
MNLVELPEPVLEKIVGYCDLADKKSLMLVCTDLYNFIGHHPALCKLIINCAFLVKIKPFIIPTGRDFHLKTIDLRLKECGRIFGSIRLNYYSLTQKDIFEIILQQLSRFEFGVRKLEMIECAPLKAKFCMLINCVQKSLEDLKITFMRLRDFKEIEAEVDGNEVSPPLDFCRLKKLVVLFDGEDQIDHNEVDIFKNTPLLENLKVYYGGVQLISGKSRLKKLTLNCTYSEKGIFTRFYLYPLILHSHI